MIDSIDGMTPTTNASNRAQKAHGIADGARSPFLQQGQTDPRSRRVGLDGMAGRRVRLGCSAWEGRSRVEFESVRARRSDGR